MRKWEGDDPGINNQKTPTILLLTPNKVLIFRKNSSYSICTIKINELLSIDIINCLQNFSVSIHSDSRLEIATMIWIKKKLSNGFILTR